MEDQESWQAAFSIYEQAKLVPNFWDKLKANESMRKNMLRSIDEGIAAMNGVGNQEIANVGRRLYNEFSGERKYQLVDVAAANASLKERIHMYTRHGESYGGNLTAVGALQAIGLAERAKEVYAGRKPRLFCSNADRTYHTAEPISTELGIEIERRSELDETSENFVGFVRSTKEDAIFITHQPNLRNILSFNMDCGDSEVNRMRI